MDLQHWNPLKIEAFVNQFSSKMTMPLEFLHEKIYIALYFTLTSLLYQHRNTTLILVALTACIPTHIRTHSLDRIVRKISMLSYTFLKNSLPGKHSDNTIPLLPFNSCGVTPCWCCHFGVGWGSCKITLGTATPVVTWVAVEVLVEWHRCALATLACTHKLLLLCII